MSNKHGVLHCQMIDSRWPSLRLECKVPALWWHKIHKYSTVRSESLPGKWRNVAMNTNDPTVIDHQRDPRVFVLGSCRDKRHIFEFEVGCWRQQPLPKPHIKWWQTRHHFSNVPRCHAQTHSNDCMRDMSPFCHSGRQQGVWRLSHDYEIIWKQIWNDTMRRSIAMASLCLVPNCNWFPMSNGSGIKISSNGFDEEWPVVINSGR